MEKNTQKGFIVLVGVMLATIISTITIGVLNIALKEVTFSSIARTTTDASFAADVGIECALYHDKTSIDSFSLADSGENINCAGQVINPSYSGNGTTTATYTFTVPNLNTNTGQCAKVTISKDNTTPPMVTTITAKGYNIGDGNCNSTNPNRVERVFEASVNGTAGGGGPDPSPTSFTLAVNVSGSGSGSVSSSPSGISCGADCSEDYADGTDVTLNATPGGSSTFAGWSGDADCGDGSVTMSANRSCIATFDLPAATYTVTPSAGSNGSISPSTVQTVSSGSQVVFDVFPSPGYTATMGGDCGGSPSSGSSTFAYTTNPITANCTVSATFALSGPISVYYMNEGSGGTTADSADGNTGTLNSVTWSTGPSGHGNAIQFNNAATSYVGLGTAANLVPSNAITVMAWINTNNRGATQMIMGKYNNAVTPYQLRIQATGNIRFGINTGTETSVTTSTAPIAFNNTWYHVAGTWDGTTMRIYVNGNPVTSAGKTGTMTSNTVDARIGVTHNSLFPFNGIIDDVKIYNRALGQAEISAAMADGGSPANNPPTANAGSDQSITLPTSSVNMAGSAADSDGTISSTNWSFISGPATPTIVTPSSLTTSITGLSSAGTYVFRLTATDNQSATGTDDMQVVVSAAPMSGTLTPTASSCLIPLGSSSCTIDFTWNTTNPVGTSEVTSDTDNSGNSFPGFVVATGNSGGPIAFTIPFNGRNFYLYNNAVPLDNEVTTSSCASGTWNGSICASAANVGPIPTNATISSSTVTADGSSIYSITLTGTDANGGSDIIAQTAIINYQGANAGSYRGYMAWSNQGFSLFGTASNTRTCTGGGEAAEIEEASLGGSYINLISCATSVSGDTRTSTLVVSFDPSFTTPPSDNTLSTLVIDTALVQGGWSPFGTFGLTASSQPNLTAASPSPSTATAGVSTSISALVSNTGTADTGSSFNNLFQFDNDADHSSVFSTNTNIDGPLSASSSISVLSSFTFPSAGQWYMRACADNDAGFNGTISESDEGDNCSPAWTEVTVSAAPTSNISFVGANAAGGTTISIPAHQAGDIIVMFAYRDGSTTVPTMPAGWNLLGNSSGGGGGAANSARLAYTTGTGSTTSGTWTNATGLVVQVFRGASAPGIVGETGAQSSTTVTYPGLSLFETNGTSWVAGFAGHQSVNTNLQNPPSGMTNRATFVNATAEIAGHSTTSGVSSWSSQNVSISGTAASWRAMTVEIRSQ